MPGVVARRGYEATSVADIVKAAAVSRNAFYKNFSDKARLVLPSLTRLATSAYSRS